MAKRYKDLSGQRFGRLVAQKYLYTEEKHRSAVWLCKCDCGVEIQVRADCLKNNTHSCGCLHKDIVSVKGKNNIIHGHYQHRLYNIHQGIKGRCLRPTEPAYKNYGARGITVCEEWKNSFAEFYNWAINHGYKDNLTIDRIDNNKGYCPENCRWTDRKTQGRNTRTNHLITYNGETRCAKEWAEILGIRYYNIWWRLRKGWPIEKVLTKPIHRK